MRQKLHLDPGLCEPSLLVTHGERVYKPAGLAGKKLEKPPFLKMKMTAIYRTQETH
jgi:hypothetical protein